MMKSQLHFDVTLLDACKEVPFALAISTPHSLNASDALFICSDSALLTLSMRQFFWILIAPSLFFSPYFSASLYYNNSFDKGRIIIT